MRSMILIASKRHDDAAQTIDQQIVAQQFACRYLTVLDASERQGNRTLQ